MPLTQQKPEGEGASQHVPAGSSTPVQPLPLEPLPPAPPSVPPLEPSPLLPASSSRAAAAAASATYVAQSCVLHARTREGGEMPASAQMELATALGAPAPPALF
jgi:hypothetical protein